MSHEVDQERKGLGLPMRTSDLVSQIGGDEQLFKIALITPQEPIGIANFEITKPDGTKENIRVNVPKLVPTMAIGNLNIKEVYLARIFAEMSRICAFNGYNDLAIQYYLKWVHLDVTGQSYMGQLLTQVLTETVSINRKEEAMSGTHDFTGEKRSKLNELMNKWKSKDGSAFTGQQGTQPQGQQGTQFGLR
jgi:hypothetical protein